MKVFLVLFGLLASVNALSAQVSFSMEGQVISAEPRYRVSTTPRRECWTEEIQVQSSSGGSDRSYGGSIIGGIAGGIMGNHVGGGRGKDAATAVGAAIGAVIGDRFDNDGRSGGPQVQYRTEQQQRCRSVSESREIMDGYDVLIRFQGRDIMFRMNSHPGQGTINLNFNGSVNPAR